MGNEDQVRMDVYIRMNGDPENDYCLSLNQNAPVSLLDDIVRRIPVQLAPSYFYDRYPAGFAVSTHPGYLTAEGAILFTSDADSRRWLKRLDPSATIGDVIVEGQLVVPLWHFNQQRHLLFVTVLLGWLYLDLPEPISPTPGTAPSKLFFKWVASVYPDFVAYHESFFDAWGWHVLFFLLHTLKVLFIYFIFRIGLCHPRSLNWLKRLPKVKVPSREELLDIGWTGARRTGKDDWPEKYRQYRIDRAGGVMKAFSSGLLSKPVGIMLEPGEGWNCLTTHSPTELPRVDKNFLDANGKFVISKKYLDVLAKPLAKYVADPEHSIEEKVMRIKEFRTYGFLDGPPELCELFDTLVPTHSDDTSS